MYQEQIPSWQVNIDNRNYKSPTGYPTAYGMWILQHAKLVIILCVVAAVLATAGASRLTNTPDNRVFFSDDNPHLQALEALENTYTRTDNVFIAMAPKSGTIATPAVMTAIREITEAAWQMPYSSRVDSLSNYQNTSADGDDLLVASLIGDEAISEQDATEAVEIALSKEFLVNRLISPDAKVSGLNITILKPENNNRAVYEVVDYTDALVADFEARYPDINFYTTGGAAFDVAFADLPNNEGAVLIPIMFCIILVIVGFSLKTVWATVSVMLLIFLSVGVAMGLTGWAGAVLNAGTSGAPVIILTLSVAHCVHLLVIIRQKMAQGWQQKPAIVESLRINIAPIFITSATTAIGFLTLNFSDAPPFQLLGNIVATGVMAGFVLSVTLLPALLSLVKIKPASSVSPLRNVMSVLGQFVVRFNKPLLWIAGTIVLVLSLGSVKIKLDDNFLTYFDEKFEIRRDTDFVEQNLTGLNAIEWSVPATEDGGISDPQYLAVIEDFTAWLKQQPKVTNVGGISTTIKELNKSMNGDDPDFLKIPESRELAAQYLLLYEMSLPFGLDLNNTIDVAKSQSRVIALLQNSSSADLRELNANAERWLQENAAEHYAEGSGLSMIFAYISERNINSMLFGSLVALVLISFILCFALRNLKIGLISLIPNLVPAAMALGFWGYTVGVAGLSIAVVVAVTLGIVVDDTVHFLSKYLRARREQGMSPSEAVVNTFETVGVALWITSVALIAGFLVLYWSGFKVNSEMGILTAVTIAFALIADFFLLPSVLMAADREQLQSEPVNH